MDKEALQNKFILIVDDNKINQMVTQRVLKIFGVRHHTVSNGLEAVEATKIHTFDIILMDINMPVMDGKQASKHIRDLNNNVPIIAISATDDVNINEELASYGINDHITKPYDNDLFLQMLIKHV